MGRLRQLIWAPLRVSVAIVGKKPPGKPWSMGSGCTEDSKHFRCLIWCCLESRNNGLKVEMLMSPLSQLSTSIFFIFGGFGATEAALRSLKCKCDCF